MKIIETKNAEEMSQLAAEIIIQQVSHSPSLTLGLATGSTPLGTYACLTQDFKRNHTLYKKVNTVNLDEYVGLGGNHPNSYHTYMRQHLFDHLDIPASQFHLPNGLAVDLEEECERYEALIDNLGGVDLQILGIGANGHIGFNEPGTSFHSSTHVVELTSTTRQANAQFFDCLESVPKHAITMGIQTILKSKQILLLASGIHKAPILQRLFQESINEEIPATSLNLHQHVTIIADTAALSQLKEQLVDQSR